jgi:hypothetical protein
LLRARRERPRRRAAEERDEIAAPEVEHGLLPATRCASLQQAQDALEAPAQPAVPAYSRLRMPWKHPQVLRVELNRSEGRLRGAAAPAADVTPIATNRLAPEVLEPIRRQLGVAHRVLNVLVAEPCL